MKKSISGVHTTLLEQEQSSMLYDTYVLALPTGHKAKSNNGSPSEKWHLACQLEGGQDLHLPNTNSNLETIKQACKSRAVGKTNETLSQEGTKSCH